MKMNRKLTLATIFGVAFALAASAASAETVITVVVNNKTTAQAVYSYINGAGSSTPATPSNIIAGGNTTFSVSNTYNFPIATWIFYYTAGTKQCKSIPA